MASAGTILGTFLDTSKTSVAKCIIEKLYSVKATVGLLLVITYRDNDLVRNSTVTLALYKNQNTHYKFLILFKGGGFNN